MIWRNFPLFRPLIGIVLGNTLAGILTCSSHTFYVLLAFGLIGCFALLFKKEKNKRSIGVFLFLLLTTCGFVTRTARETAALIPSTNPNKTLAVGELEGLPKKRPYGTQASVKIILRKDSTSTWTSANEKVWCTFSGTQNQPGLKMGDRIVFLYRPKEISPPFHPDQFNFRKYMEKKGIYTKCYLENHTWKKLTQSNTFILSRYVDRIRRRLLSTIEKNCTEKTFALSKALIFGEKDELDFATKMQFAATGVIHILPVSGLHVGIVFLSINALVKRVFKRFLLRSLCLLSSLWTYAILAGCSPSVLRATLMYSFVGLAVVANRPTQLYNSILDSALLLICIVPKITDEIGFQLSYAAVLGIVTLFPILENRIVIKYKWAKRIISLAGVSTAAQLATFPLTGLYFQQFPLYFLPTNLLVLPLVTLSIYLGIALIGLGWLNILNTFLAVLLDGTLHTMLFFVEQIAALPNAVISIEFGVMTSIALICMLVLLVLYMNQNRALHLVLFLLATSLVFALQYTKKRKQSTVEKLTVSSLENGLRLDLKKGATEVRLVTHDSIVGSLVKRRTKKFEVPKNTIGSLFWQSGPFLQFAGMQMMFLNNNQLPDDMQHNVNLDLLLIGKECTLSLPRILETLTTNVIVSDKGLPWHREKHLENQAKKRNLDYFSIQKVGFCEFEISKTKKAGPMGLLHKK